jgi:hypothetical protein
MYGCCGAARATASEQSAPQLAAMPRGQWTDPAPCAPCARSWEGWVGGKRDRPPCGGSSNGAARETKGGSEDGTAQDPRRANGPPEAGTMQAARAPSGSQDGRGTADGGATKAAARLKARPSWGGTTPQRFRVQGRGGRRAPGSGAPAGHSSLPQQALDARRLARELALRLEAARDRLALVQLPPRGVGPPGAAGLESAGRRVSASGRGAWRSLRARCAHVRPHPRWFEPSYAPTRARAEVARLLGRPCPLHTALPC